MVELGVYMVVGDGYVYKMDKNLEVVSSGVEMGKDLEVGSDRLVEGKHR